MVKKLSCILLAMLMLCGCGASPKETVGNQAVTPEQKVSLEFNTEQPAGIRENVLSLNGTWGFCVDTQEKAQEIKADKATGEESLPLNGESYSVTLQVKELTDQTFVKAKAWICTDETLLLKDGQAELHLMVRLNGGDWVATNVGQYANGQRHWVDLKLNRADLKTGENVLEITSNASKGLWLLADAGQKPSLRLRSMTTGNNWTEIAVPAAAEGQFELSYADRIYPDTFNGIMWYRKSFTVADLKNQWLCFNGIDYKADVWLNGAYLGSHEGGYTQFEFCLDGLLQENNTLVVRVVDQDWNNGLTEDDIHIKETLAGFTQDTRELNYSGIWQSVYVEKRDAVSIDDVYVLTKDYTIGNIEVWVTLYNPSEEAVETKLSLTVKDTAAVSEQMVTVASMGRTQIKTELTVENPKLWDVDNPELYTIVVQAGEDSLSQEFGIRQIWVEGNKIVYNGQPIFLTGMLHWGSYYENYTSAVAQERVRYEITELKKAGFNAIKYCLFSPPEYILDICDEMGMYVYIEYPIWNVKETEVFFERAYLQMMELVEKDRIHPCVIMSDFNCEDLEFTAEMDELMAWCVETAKTVDPNRLYTDNSSNGEHRYGDFATCHPYYQAGVFETMLDGWIQERGNQPLILGEYADISVLRDIQELNSQSTEQYTWYHEYYEDVDQGQIMRDAGYTEAQIDAVIEQSVLNAQELRKYYLEKSKSEEAVAGLFLTHIFESPNGWADGWFDDLYQPHFDADYIRMSAGENTLLLNETSVNYWAGQSYTIESAVSLYGGQDLNNAVLSYTLLNGESVITEGKVENITLKNGNYYVLPDFVLEFPQNDSAVRYTLCLTVTQQEMVIQNQWNIWAYPKDTLTGTEWAKKNVQVYDPANKLKLGSRYSWMRGFSGSGADLVVCTELSGTILNYLQSGGKVIYVGSNTDLTQTIDNWDYNRFSFAFLPDPHNSLALSLRNLGYGGIQFLDLATATHLAMKDGGTNIIGRFGITDGTINTFMGEFTIGQGTLLQTTLRLDNTDLWLGGNLLTHESLAVSTRENVLGSYLLEQMIIYELGK